jgi:hypothetical protein
MISKKENKVFVNKNKEKQTQKEPVPMQSVQELQEKQQLDDESKKRAEAEQKIDKEPEVKKFEFVKILAENLTGTTFHSIGYIFETPDYFLKIVLSICFLASAVYCGYVLVLSFIQFFSFGVLTTTSVVSDIPAECEFQIQILITK